MIKTLSKLRTEGNFLNMIKDTWKNNIHAQGARQKTFSLTSGQNKGTPLSLLPLNTVPEVLARAIRQEKEVRLLKWKGRSKMFSISDSSRYNKIPKNPHTKKPYQSC